MERYLNVTELCAITNFPVWRARKAIQLANKIVRQSGGMVVQGYAPKKILERVLCIDLPEASKEA